MANSLEMPAHHILLGDTAIQRLQGLTDTILGLSERLCDTNPERVLSHRPLDCKDQAVRIVW